MLFLLVCTLLLSLVVTPTGFADPPAQPPRGPSFMEAPFIKWPEAGVSTPLTFAVAGSGVSTSCQWQQGAPARSERRGRTFLAQRPVRPTRRRRAWIGSGCGSR